MGNCIIFQVLSYYWGSFLKNGTSLGFVLLKFHQAALGLFLFCVN